ncbi:MAG: NAD(P)-binding domain-containing protein [Planctomycetota bacterium]
MANHRTRVLIVGAGPIGIELAVACKKNGVDFELVDAGSVGHTMTWWAPQTRWFSSNERIAIADVPLLTVDQGKATREEYLTYLRGVLAQHDIAVRTRCKVVQVERQFDPSAIDPGSPKFRVLCEASEQRIEFGCDCVVLAIGGTDYPNRLGIPGEGLPHVDGYLRETHSYFGRRVMVIGGRNSAVEAALRLHHAGANVSLSYRGDELPEKSIKYWLLPEIKGLIESGRIRAFFRTRPIEITASEVRLEAADGSVVNAHADDVLTLVGYAQDKTLLRSAGVELVGPQQTPQFDTATMETNVPGIYIAGTAIAGTQSSKYRVFLENCHDHVNRIIAHVMGRSRESSTPAYSKQVAAQPES